MSEKKIIKVDDIKNEADKRDCPVERAVYYVEEFLAGPMCGKCFPCALGSYEARIILYNIIENRGSEADMINLNEIAKEMLISSRCKKGKDTARYILEWMGTDVFDKHIKGVCPSRTCAAFIEYRIINENCTACGICKDICDYKAIYGEKVKPFINRFQPFEIRQQKCVKCGECMKVCPTGTIKLLSVKETAEKVKIGA
ncbi:MAG TPA: 4Fe-4S dicluster domain-containing protein [Nitrospirae bacterium]|nr:4Fe-4S dicluster domain-containing protein [Nitrospirota bacterium]